MDFVAGGAGGSADAAEAAARQRLNTLQAREWSTEAAAVLGDSCDAIPCEVLQWAVVADKLDRAVMVRRAWEAAKRELAEAQAVLKAAKGDGDPWAVSQAEDELARATEAERVARREYEEAMEDAAGALEEAAQLPEDSDSDEGDDSAPDLADSLLGLACLAALGLGGWCCLCKQRQEPPSAAEKSPGVSQASADLTQSSCNTDVGQPGQSRQGGVAQANHVLAVTAAIAV